MSRAVCSRRLRIAFTTVFGLGALAYTGLMMSQIEMPDGSRSDAFHWLILFYLPSILTVGAMGLWHHLKQGVRSGQQVMFGVLVTLFAAGWQISGVGLHPHFNHNDIFHVIQMVGLWLLGNGALGLQSRQSPL
jgi:asparagine N-glycosylation enzyme membrane subunit Stt3